MEEIGVPMKTCRKCGVLKPLAEFDLRADTGKPRGSCKACRRQYQQERWQCSTNPNRSRRVIGALDLYPCRRCGEFKSANDFNRRAVGSRYLHSWCKVCFAAYKAERHVRLHDREMVRIRRNRELGLSWRRAQIREYLLAHPCVDCGETDPDVLEFDHLRDKTMDVSRMVAIGWKWAKIFAEIQKCEVRCANDHRRATKRRHKERKEALA